MTEHNSTTSDGDLVKGKTLREKILQHIYIATLVGSLIFYGLLSIPGFVLKINDYWTGYWASIPTYLAVVIAVVTFHSQQEEHTRDLKKQEAMEKRNRYLEYQEKIENELIPKLANFSPMLKGTKTKPELVADLVALLSAADKMDLKRKVLLPDEYLEDDEITDLSEFTERTEEIVRNKDYNDVVNTVADIQSNFYLTINRIRDEMTVKLKREKDKEDMLKGGYVAEEKQSYVVDGETERINSNILGNWILKYENAENAKYLVGVSTRDKRILGVYKLKGDPKQLDENNRVLFSKEETLYIEKSNKKEDRAMPGLDNWTSRNPVLYYKKYLKSKNFELENENMSYVLDKLNLTKEQYNHLSEKEIIVVRTNKFG